MSKIILITHKFFGKIDIIISSTILLGLVLLSFINAILRYFFNSPIQWTEEVLVAGFIWSTFSCIGFCYRHDGFIHIDIVDTLLSKNKIIVLSFWINCFIFLFGCIILYWSAQLSYQASVKLTNILRIPYSYIDISLVFGSILLIKESIAKILSQVKNNLGK